ncbi:MAG: hypothetical protein ACD_77C00365G0001, partial [uncultured bacterium]
IFFLEHDKVFFLILAGGNFHQYQHPERNLEKKEIENLRNKSKNLIQIKYGLQLNSK